MSDTPRTDAAERMAFNHEYMVPTDFARRLEREVYHARQQRDGWADECERSMPLLNDALDSFKEAIKQRDTYAAALREIMQNEECLHRMGYNPYLIASAALKGGAQ